MRGGSCGKAGHGVEGTKVNTLCENTLDYRDTGEKSCIGSGTNRKAKKKEGANEGDCGLL